ncbi:adhesion G protein-coupled receptor A2-like isoform X1 [Pieris brassicae]|uniref:G-protein coupled receptors family 2 profile 2 domain-containing protein n=1 Tax=Pieris brassicae TaxID=7116 RepID=A0A9P0XKM7_PIEBR|nr:adhesion G protein-coupled receptor A2-like isoform X1 [Pieris brassicae]CAH4038715.1 unnamed protein product [Pieris brassicae]
MDECSIRGHRSKDYYGRSTKRDDMNMEITSPVVGFQLDKVSIRGELLEHIIITVRLLCGGGVEARAAVWEHATRRWTDNTTGNEHLDCDRVAIFLVHFRHLPDGGRHALPDSGRFDPLSISMLPSMSASNMYKWVMKTHGLVRTPEDEIPPDIPVQKPILGLYLVGWGIALIVCGISGAVNMKDYAGYSQCFLSTAPALSALFIPGVILLMILSILFLLIRCTIRNTNVQLSEGTQATENVDLEMWYPNQANEADSRSIKSGVDSVTEDVEHTPII